MATGNIKVRGITIRFQADYSGVLEAFSKMRTATTQTAKKLNDVNKLLKMDPKNNTLLNQKWKYLGEQIENTRKKIQEARKTIEALENEKATQGVKDVTEQMEALERQIIEDENQLKKLEKEFARFSVVGEKIKATGLQMQEFGKKVRDVGYAVNMHISERLIRGMRELVRMANDAETSYTKVFTIASEMAEDNALGIERLKYAVRDASDETGIAITDFNEALYQTISASVATADAIDFTTDAIKLARGGFTTTEQAVDLMTTIMNAYGIEASKATDIMDRLIATQNFGKTTVDQLAVSLGRMIPSAKMAGVNLDNVSTGMALMTKRGIQTRIAATALRSFYDEINKSGSKADDALREMTGKGFKQLLNSGKSIVDILHLLQGAADEAGVSLSDMFGNVRSRMAVASIMADNGEEYNRLLGEIANSAGAAERAFEKMNATPAVRMQIALNKLKNVGIEIGADLLPMVTEGIELLHDLVQAYQKLTPKQKKFLQTLALTGAAAGPALKVMGNFAIGMGKVTEGIGKFLGEAKAAPTLLSPLAKGLSSLLTPLGGLIAAIGPALGVFAAVAAASAAIGLIVKHSGVLDGLESKAADFIDSQQKINNLTKDATEVAAQTKQAMSESSTEINNSVAASSKLVDELEQLSNKENKTVEDTKQMKNIVSQLNYLFPELNLSINTTTSELSMTNQEIRNFVNEANNAAKAAALQKILEESYEGVFRAQKDVVYAEAELNDLLEQKDEAKKQLEAVEEAHNKNVDAANKLRKAYAKGEVAAEDFDRRIAELDSDLVEVNGETVSYSNETSRLNNLLADFADAESIAKEKVDKAQSAVDALEKEINDMSDALQKTNEEAENFNNVSDDMFTPEQLERIRQAKIELGYARKEMIDGTGSIMDVMAAQNELAAAYGDEASMIVDAYELLTESQQNSVRAFAESYNEMTASLQETVDKSLKLFDEFDKGTEMSLDQMITNLTGQIQGLHQWEQDIQTLIDKNLPQSLIDEFIAMGPESANMVHELATSTPAKLDELSAAWNEKVNAMTFADDLGTKFKEDLASNLSQGFEGVPDLLSQNGLDIVLGLYDGIVENLDQIESAAEEMGDDLNDTFADEEGISSPSKVFEEMGLNIDEGLANGINNGKPKVLEKMRSVATAISNPIVFAGAINQARNSGLMIARGLATGIEFGRFAIVQSMSAAVQAAIDTANAKLKVSSPSKVFEQIGVYTAQGFSKGVDKGFKDVQALMNTAIGNAVPQTTHNNQNVTVNMTVNGSAGQNPREIAEYTSDYIMRQMKIAGAAW